MFYVVESFYNMAAGSGLKKAFNMATIIWMIFFL